MLLEKGNHTVIIESVEDLDDIMNQLVYIFDDLFRNSHFIRIRARCHTCFKVIEDTTFHISQDSIEMESNTISCNFPKDPENHITLTSNKPSFFHIEYKEDDFNKRLAYEPNIPLLVEKTLTPYYSPNDYEVHGQMLYADRNIVIKIRSNDDRTIISFQSFIDHKGLVPKYSHTIVFYHNK